MLELLDDPHGDHVDTVAMDALRGCERCRGEAQELLLGSYAVERAWRRERAAEPSQGSLTRVRDMTRRPRGDAWRGRAHVLGISASAVLVALMSTAQLGAALGPGGGASTAEPVRAASVDRRYEPPAVAGPSLAVAPATGTSGARPAPVLERRVTRQLAADRPSSPASSGQVSPIKTGQPTPAAKGHPTTL
jgi:hypothetical protein